MLAICASPPNDVLARVSILWVGLDADNRLHPLRGQRQLLEPHPSRVGEGIWRSQRQSDPVRLRRTKKRLPQEIAARAGAVFKAAALAGHGLVCLPIYSRLRFCGSRGRLVAVLDDYTPPLTLRALYPRNRHLSAKVRAFVDFLAAI
jgi:DNA-binding transcriptional LysR family regulator